jgi:maleate cis-trans isomerase
MPDAAAAHTHPHPFRHVDRDRRIYGQELRLGLIVPSTNTVAETEFWRLAPPGVSIHTTRMLFEPERTKEGMGTMHDHMPRAVAETASARVDLIAYGCTASSVEHGPENIEREIEEQAQVPAVSTAGAILAALEFLGIRKFALATPYPAKINAHEREFFATRGFEVVADRSMLASEEQQRLRGLACVPPEMIRAAVLEMDSPAVEGFLLSCMDLPTLGLIDALEAETGKPVVTSVTCTLWQSLRKAGVATGLARGGRLLTGR